jgi:hypothetical protein
MKNLSVARNLCLALSVTFAAGLLFVNVYNSLVDVPNWGHSLPTSIEAARSYYSTANPGSFYRVFSPLNQVIALLGLVLCWKASPRVRLLCGLALIVTVSLDALTFGYFYPRNAVMFASPVANLGAIRLAHAQWAAMNWVRSAMIALNLVLAFAALYGLTSTERHPQSVLNPA